jgi:hypothetical protein
MVGEPLRLLTQAIRVVPLDGGDDGGVELPATIVEESSVGDLMGQRVLERVFQIGKQAGLVEELGRLQVEEPATQLLLGELGNGEEEGEGHVLADDRGRLEKLLVLRLQSVDPRGQDGLHSGGNVDRIDGPGESIGPTLSDQGARLHERPHAFLEEERIPAGPGNEGRLERLDRGVWSEQRQEQLVGALGR